MTKTNMDLSELLQKHDQGDLLRSIAEAVLQLMMESDVDGLIGAGRHERAEQRTTWRNGYRDHFQQRYPCCYQRQEAQSRNEGAGSFPLHVLDDSGS